ncbi:MAG: HlyC/CorC family transporter [Oscillospiraceae bacterium]|nr:HlyC/CorC family transporter [Oscillospiraceae bacterium]
MNPDSLTLPIIIFCVIMSAYFSATETAFSCLNRIRIKNMAEKGSKKAALVLRLSENYDSMLSTILIGNNIVNILSASLATVLFVNMLGSETGPTVSTAVTTVVVLIFGEISPKSIAKESPESFAMFSAPLLKILMTVLTPFNFLFGRWKRLLSLIFKSRDDSGITEEELLSIVEEARLDGGINEQEGMLIRSAIEFTETEARDILTPRIDITAVPDNADSEEIARVFRETAYSRIPVYEDSIDRITGVIYQKDFHNYVKSGQKILSEIIRPVLFIPENKKIDILLRELQQMKSHIAVVADEYGGTIGLVTLEDILEELVGEIWDEHDEVSNDFERISDTEHIVLGTASAGKLFAYLEEKADETDAATVSGWLTEKLGHIPEAGDCIEFGAYSITVISADDNRAEKLRVTKQSDVMQTESVM